MKLTRNVWRTKKNVFDRNPIPGAVIESKDYKWFVILDTNDELERFEKFVSENDMESKLVMENMLHTEFCVTDIEDEYEYTERN